MGVALRPRTTIYHIIEAGSGDPGAGQQNWVFDFRFGSEADIEASPANVRFTPKSGH
jgi:hypothetical protein